MSYGDHVIWCSAADPLNFPFVWMKNIIVPIALFNNQYYPQRSIGAGRISVRLVDLETYQPHWAGGQTC